MLGDCHQFRHLRLSGGGFGCPVSLKDSMSTFYKQTHFPSPCPPLSLPDGDRSRLRPLDLLMPSWSPQPDPLLRNPLKGKSPDLFAPGSPGISEQADHTPASVPPLILLSAP